MRTINYTLTRRDLFVFQLQNMFRSRFVIGSQLVVLGFLCHALYTSLPADTPTLAKIIMFIIVLLIGIGFSLSVMIASIASRLFSKKNKTLTADYTLTVTENGLKEETQYNTTESKWAAIQQLRRSKNYIHVFVAANLAYVIPKRAFNTQQEWNEFYTLCSDKSGKA